MKKLLCILLVISSLLCGAKKDEIKYVYPSTSGKLAVDGIHLVDEKGNNVQLKGLSTHGIGWFPEYINKDWFKQMRNEWNTNVIRLAMYTDEGGGYCTDGNKEQLKQYIHDGIQYATDNDMYVIVDWHILADQNPNKYKEESIKFFKEISKKYKDHNNVLYEICNEPNGNTTWEDIKEYANEVIPVIRKNDPDSVIIVGTPNWSQFVDQAAQSPLDFDNVMYTLHFYAATHKEDLRNKMENALKDGLPIFVSEFGICDASGNGAIDKNQASEWIDLMDKYGVSYCAWNISNKDETSAILKKDCKKTSGFTTDDLSSSGLWLYSLLSHKKVDKEIVEKVENENTGNSNGISYKYKLRDSWNSNDTMYYLYDLTLSSKKDVSSWKIEIPFQSKFELSDSWNGIYTVKGNSLLISNESWNGTISKDASISDIGFIVTSEIKDSK